MKQDARLELEPVGFARMERLAAYETANAILEAQLRLQQHFDLRAEECQVLMVIVLATVQRFMRQAGEDTPYLDQTPLPEAEKGAISRRRIAEVLGVPFETVRRHVETLFARGLILERARGQLCTVGGTLAEMSRKELPAGIVQVFLGMTNAMLRAGAVQVRRGKGWD